jgi:hypothetical protein
MLSIPADDARAVTIRTAIQDGAVDTLIRCLQEDPSLATARIVDGRGVSRTLLHLVADWPGRDVSATDPAPSREQLTNAFWHACRGGQQVTAEYLFDRGADLNWVGHDGKTPCDVAQERRDDRLTQWLLARGARGAAELESSS